MQPIIENAFEHGLEDKVNSGFLRVSFMYKEKLLSIIVEENGDNLDDTEIEHLRSMLAEENSQAESTGIINIHRRIRLKFGSYSGILVSRSPLGGLKGGVAYSN